MALLPGEPPHADDLYQRGTKEWRRAVTAHQQWIGDQAWRAQTSQNLNLSDPQALLDFLGTLNIRDEVGGGRHAYNMFTGNLPTEGWGMGYRGIPYALEHNLPDWRRWLDRSLQRGTPRAEANAQFLPQGVSPPAASTMAAPGPTGSSSAFAAPTSTYGTSSLSPDQEAYGLAQDIFRKKRPGMTLGSLAGGSY